MKVLNTKELCAVNGGQMTEEWYYASLLGCTTFLYSMSSNFTSTSMSVLVSTSISRSIIAASIGYIGGAYLTYKSSNSGMNYTLSILPSPIEPGESAPT